MGYNSEQWYSRIANRSDITSGVTHLTKPSCNIEGLTDENEINQLATDNLITILNDRVIKGSTTEKGFIVGKRTAVCFQDVPFYSLIQNIEHERQRRSANSNERYRYCGVGLAFKKPYIFNKGGRPVFYEQTKIAKKMLDKDEYWRIVNLDISDGNKIIDWTHEREWRLPGDLEFDLSKTHILLYNRGCWKFFIKNCPPEIFQEIAGVTILKNLIT